jgi:hypothetical protein
MWVGRLPPGQGYKKCDPKFKQNLYNISTELAIALAWGMS